MAPPIRATFVGGAAGEWRVLRATAVVGEPLAAAAFVAVRDGHLAPPPGSAFALRGSTGHRRYVNAREKAALDAASAPLGRPAATRAALIPIRKRDEWWELAQDERRAIFEESSRHIAGTLEFLPAIARRLYHARELGEPFDFLTWFEFAPADGPRFDELTARLRATEQWRWIDREVDLRLARDVP